MSGHKYTRSFSFSLCTFYLQFGGIDSISSHSLFVTFLLLDLVLEHAFRLDMPWWVMLCCTFCYLFCVSLFVISLPIVRSILVRGVIVIVCVLCHTVNYMPGMS